MSDTKGGVFVNVEDQYLGVMNKCYKSKYRQM